MNSSSSAGENGNGTSTSSDAADATYTGAAGSLSVNSLAVSAIMAAVAFGYAA
jgi:hypothetical protein